MKKELIDIEKAFEGRWRIKSAGLMELDTSLFHRIKELCLDFFKTGILLGEPEVTYSLAAKISLSDIIDADVDVNGFDFFWDAYDKKVGKTKAEKLWSRLTTAEKKACLDYIPAYKQAQPDKQYRKNPETFLRNKSWNDKIIFRNGTDKQQQQRDRLTEVANRIAEYTKDAK